MKVSYDKEVDAAYIKLSSKRPHEAIEIDEGVVLHVTKGDKIAGIEILNASSKIPVKNLFDLEVETKKLKRLKKKKQS